jgi:Tol biopolymer transport system component
MRKAFLVGLAIGAVACSNSTRHGGSGGAGGTGGGGSGGSAGSGGNLPPATHEVVDPSLPPGVVGGFDGAPPGQGGVTLVYPNPGALVPHDLAPIDVQWNGATPVYRVTFAVDNGNKLRGYVTSADWVPPAAEWTWLLDVAAGHQIALSVDGATIDGNGTPQGPLASATAQPLAVSRDDATGALFYFATTGDQVSGDGTLERLELGAQKADKYLNKTNDGGKCVGCHALTRDGTRVAFTFLDLTQVITGNTMTLGSVDATNPTAQQAAANTTAATSSFSPDGKQIVSAYNGKLSIRDAVTGALVSDLSTTGTAMFPDWSPDGNTIVFVRSATACAASAPNFGQASIYAYGGSLVTLTNTGGTWGNEQVLLQAATGENNYYPSFSPDGQWIAFTRASTSTKSSWSVANSACTGQDGSGLSYDNPSATIFIVPAAGGSPTELTAANGAPMKTNSWPKWGPKADGEFLWLSFSSTREYGNVLTGLNAHHQVWITAIPRGGEAMGDLSTPAVWFPFQDTTTKNHIGVWSVKVGGYNIP